MNKYFKQILKIENESFLKMILKSFWTEFLKKIMIVIIGIRFALDYERFIMNRDRKYF